MLVQKLGLVRPVVLIVSVRQCSVSMPCSIVGETTDAVRIYIEPGWEMNVGKGLILAIEEETVVRDATIN